MGGRSLHWKGARSPVRRTALLLGFQVAWPGGEGCRGRQAPRGCVAWPGMAWHGMGKQASKPRRDSEVR